jgi:hypothetical protein
MKNDTTSTGSSQTTADPTSAAPSFAGGWLDGTLVLFEPSRELLLVRADDTRTKVAIHWEPDTQFVMEGRPASYASLRPGQRVHIHCRMARHELSADHISLEPPAVRKPGAPTQRTQLRSPHGGESR